jgi:type I restriction enzyme S subunit
MFGDPVTNPKGWNTGIIDDLTMKTQYGTSKKADENFRELPVLRMNNITYSGGWDFSSLKYVDLNEKERSKYLVNKGELLFNRTNSKELVGKTAVYRKTMPMAYAGYLVKLIPNKNANTEYISAYLNSKHGKLVLLNMAKNIVGMANINAEELKKIKILLPPIELQNQFAETVQKIELQKELMQQSLTELENNFNSLMQKAFKGELFND